MFLGIDIGTSAVKSVLIDDEGVAVATASAPLSVSRPHPTWSEQDPGDWWLATDAAVLTLPANVRADVRAVGLSGQMHGATVLGDDLRPLRPAILWNDGRSAAECTDLQEQEPAFVERGANLVMPGFTAPKLAWLRRHEPTLFDRIHKVLLPKDYIRLMMTGELASDRSDSAGTLWMDVAARNWHEALLHACGLTTDHMPALFDGPEITGQLRTNIAQKWGMPCVPVVAGGGDNAAGAVGAGVVNEGDTLMSLGTSGVIFTACDAFRARPESAVHAFCHALPERWHLMSVMLSAASCFQWACNVTNVASVDKLTQLAEQSNPNDRTLFLPYLSGERTPHNDALATGTLFGMTHDTGPAEIATAVLQGVAFGMADGFDALQRAGARIEALSVIGGGARSMYLGETLAAVIGRPLVYRESAEVGPALGAARLAQCAITGDDVVDLFSPPPTVASITPDPALVDRITPQRSRFQALYQTLKPTFAETTNARQ
ncbi:MAG: xylulokinase [Gammaproteobacteria bacterium]